MCSVLLVNVCLDQLVFDMELISKWSYVMAPLALFLQLQF